VIKVDLVQIGRYQGQSRREETKEVKRSISIILPVRMEFLRSTGGFRFGVPLCGGLVCSENERLAFQRYIGLLGHPL